MRFSCHHSVIIDDYNPQQLCHFLTLLSRLPTLSPNALISSYFSTWTLFYNFQSIYIMLNVLGYIYCFSLYISPIKSLPPSLLSPTHPFLMALRVVFWWACFFRILSPLNCSSPYIFSAHFIKKKKTILFIYLSILGLGCGMWDLCCQSQAL